MSIDLLEGIREQLRKEELVEVLTDLVKVPSENFHNSLYPKAK